MISMESLVTFTTPPHVCSYLPDRAAGMRYEIVAEVSPAEYQDRLQRGWRRFGFSLFRPECTACQECRSVRVPIATFQPDRSQRRAWAANVSEVRLEIGVPAVSREKLRLYDRFHTFQSETKGWSEHSPKDPDNYIESFVENPFPTEEWCYYLGDRLVGVGYVDRLPEALSAIYFFHEPDERRRSLGTFNVLSVIENARQTLAPFVYLGYYVVGCRSLEYKGRFRPNEVLGPTGWSAFLP
jgi:arginyl-tRNA--protein-N-Asp/Glu arginylyltransferase